MAFDSDSAARHLLRHISEPRALRRNPLVAGLFGPKPDLARDRIALRKIRDTIVASLDPNVAETPAGSRQADSHARQRAIVLRCDLNGEPHRRVAAALGLERRQFYRERRRARDRIVAAFLNQQHSADYALCAIDRFGLSLAHVRSLRASGSYSRAASIAREVRCESVDSARRIEAGSLLVEILAESGSVLEGAEVLRDLNQLKAPSDDLAAKMLLATAQLSEASGDFEGSSTAIETTIALLERKGAARTPEADNLLARAYVSLSFCREVNGNIESSVALLAKAGAFLDRHPWLAPDVSAQVLCNLGMAHATILPGGADVAAAYLSRAYAIAERHALAREAADIAIGIANVHAGRHEFDEALELGLSGLSLSENLHGPIEHAWRCFNVAWVAFQAGKPAISIELARRAAALGPPQPLRIGFAKSIESSVLFKSGNMVQAREPIGSAIAVLRGAGNQRFLGYALRVNAEVNYSLRCLDEARTSIEEAVDLLSRCDYLGGLAPAMRTQAKILGKGCGAV